jgi:hypothetical protein
MEVFLRALLPRLLPREKTFEIHQFLGKSDLLAKLEARLRAYAVWLPENWRIVVVVDRDNEDCRVQKRRLAAITQRAGLRTRTDTRGSHWQLVNRIAIEELEAWYFGDWAAVRDAYPRVPATIPNRRGFRDPDAISGGTWEAFERVMRRYGYFEGGFAKLEAARTIGTHIEPSRSRSHSFLVFCEAISEAMA